MSVIATAVRHLMAAGVTGEALVAAIAEMEAAQPVKDAAAERRRAWDRERKRKIKSGGIPVESAESTEQLDRPLSLSPNENNSNPHTHTPGDITPARKGLKFPCPDGVDPEDWAGLLESRKGQRAPMTERAYVKICSKLKTLEREGWPPGPLVATAVERGWRTVFKPTEHTGTRNDRTASNDQAPRNPYVRAVIARQAARSADERGQSGSWSERSEAAF